MGIRLKPIDEQVVVITGADSGIGLATAQAAAERGARLVLCSRNEEELARISAELRADGADVEWFAGDVGDERAMLELAEVAIRAFGRIDTWVNNAGVSIYGEVDQVPVEDARRLFETNYFGVVNGSLAALPYLRATGGALVNVGSILSDRAIPLQGHYSASKHAVKAFTDSLRMELAKEGAPVSVTLVKPGAIDTPYPEHARNYMDAPPRHPRPVYAPEVVADAILECAEHPTPSVTVGGGGRMNAMMGILAPRLTDRFMEAAMFRQQKRSGPTEIPPEDTLYAPPRRTGRVHGDQPGHIMKSSAYTAAARNPGKVIMAVAGLGIGVALASRFGLFGLGSAGKGTTGQVELDVADRPQDADFAAGDRVTVEAVEVVEVVEAGRGAGYVDTGGRGYGDVPMM
jgi:short-subunit dehydrogenase